jgi:hypothetical protein
MLPSCHQPKALKIPLWCVLFLCLIVVGCSRDDWLKLYGYNRASLLKKNLPQEDEALARHCVDLLLQGRFDEIEELLGPGARSADLHAKLAEMSSYFPSRPISVKPVEAGVNRGGDSSTTSITLEYQFQHSWLLAYFVIRRQAGARTITTFRITPTAEPFETMNQFTLDNKGFSQYAGLLLTLSVAALTLYSFILCARMKIGNKKWIWLPAILVGVCRVTVNWTSGKWFFTPLALHVPPVEVSCSAYGPWMLQIFSPVGAIAFLRLGKRLVPEAVPLTIAPDAEPATESSAADVKPH